MIIHNNSGNDLKSRICPVCKRRFVNKRQYKVIRKYCGSNKIIPELYIMDYSEQNKQNDETQVKFDKKEVTEQSHFRGAVIK